MVFVPIPVAIIFNFAPAIIMIFKVSTTLHASGSSIESALTQAESGYQKSNIGLKVAQSFFAAPQKYSVQKIVDFIMGAFVSVFLHY